MFSKLHHLRAFLRNPLTPTFDKPPFNLIMLFIPSKCRAEAFRSSHMNYARVSLDTVSRHLRNRCWLTSSAHSSRVFAIVVSVMVSPSVAIASFTDLMHSSLYIIASWEYSWFACGRCSRSARLRHEDRNIPANKPLSVTTKGSQYSLTPSINRGSSSPWWHQRWASGMTDAASIAS